MQVKHNLPYTTNPNPPHRRTYIKSTQSVKRMSGKKVPEEKKRKADENTVKMREQRQRISCKK